MRRLVFIIGILFLSYWGIGQGCLSGSTTFSTQQEIDDFLIDNPNCTEIEGSISIQGNGIVNLNGFRNIQKINNIEIVYIDILDFSGLDNLWKVNSFIISDSKFNSFKGLEKLDSIFGGFNMSYCSRISDFTGINCSYFNEFFVEGNQDLLSIEGIRASILQSFFIAKNPSLTTLNIDLIGTNYSGSSFSILNNTLLSNIIFDDSVQIVSNISILNNESLIYFSANEHMKIDRITVFDNPKLNTCETLCEIAQNAEEYQIYNNSLQCNIDDASFCDPGIFGRVFFDINKNGVYEQNEFPMNGAFLLIVKI